MAGGKTDTEQARWSGGNGKAQNNLHCQNAPGSPKVSARILHGKRQTPLFLTRDRFLLLWQMLSSFGCIAAGAMGELVFSTDKAVFRLLCTLTQILGCSLLKPGSQKSSWCDGITFYSQTPQVIIK